MVKTVVKEFLDYSTVHGLGRVKNSPFIGLKAFWILALVASLGIIGWQVNTLYIKYKSHPVSMSVELKTAETMRFPTVTICNTNPVQPSRVSFLSDLYGSILSASILKNLKHDDLLLEQDFFKLRMSAITNEELEKVSQPKESFMPECFFAGRPCNESAWDLSTRTYEYGFCHTFDPSRQNPLEPDGEVAAAGHRYALQMVLNVDHTESIPHITMSNGVVVFATTSKRKFLDQRDAIQVPIGFETAIALSRDQDARIIMTAMYVEKAREVLCAAYKIGLYGPKIVWFIFGFFKPNFWKEELDNVDCTAEEMEQAAEGIFLLSFSHYDPAYKIGIANVSADDWFDVFRSDPEYRVETAGFDHIGGNCFDSTWMIALALNCTVTKLEQIGYPKTIDQITYSDEEVHNIIFDCMGSTTMVGVTGKIMFENGLDPERTVVIHRVQDGKRTLLAYYKVDRKPNYIVWIEGSLKWKDGNIPRDSTITIREERVIPPLLYAVICTTSGCGILLATAFLIFNIVLRENRTVKMSSPNINNVLLLGCAMCYISVLVKPVEVADVSFCRFKDACFCLGFTITFGSLFSKTWRVYRIFTNKQLLRMTIKDKQLLVIISVLAAVVMAVVAVWEIVAPHEIIIKNLYQEIIVIGNDVEIHPYVSICVSIGSSYFQWTLYILEGTLLAFGAFLAWETRNVKIAALNDSRQIGLCLYNAVILSAMGLTLNLLLSDQDILLYGVSSAFLIIGTTLTQLIVFVPKVLEVSGKAEGRTSLVDQISKTNVDHTASDDC